jgi:hypothetical protein
MKTILIIIFLLGSLITNATELGLGIVDIDIYKTKEIKIYKNKNDKTPERIIHLIEKNGEIAIKENDYQKWLKPESIWLDYSIFIFRYTNFQDNWIEIIVNNDSMIKMWIRKTETTSVKTWQTFLVKNTTAVEPLISTEIKLEPSDNAKTIRKSAKEDCFEAIEIQGDWMKIRTNEELDCNEHPAPIKSGWIKWRQNNKLTIAFFLTC